MVRHWASLSHFRPVADKNELGPLALVVGAFLTAYALLYLHLRGLL
jgi:hypothetical protein